MSQLFFNKQEQELTKLAVLQKSDGSYTLDDRLACILGISIRTLREECAKNEWDEEAWATVTVLAYFVTRLSHFSEDWELLAEKAKLWLSDLYDETATEEMLLRALNLFPKA